MTSAVSTFTVISCRWDWCRSSFPSIDALHSHVKHEHIWPMKPMRMAEIALMRRMDLQSLHSSLITESSTVSKGIPSHNRPITHVSRSETPPPAAPATSTHEDSDSDEFNTFSQLSSPPQTLSPPKLSVSPAFEGLVRQDGYSGLSAAVELFERTRGHKTKQRARLPHLQRSPLSWSSTSSQEVVEQQLTQEDDVLPSELQTQDRLVDTELRWPTDDESDVLAPADPRNSEQLVSKRDHPQDSSPVSTRGRNFRCGSLDVPLGMNNYTADPPSSSAAGSHSQSQPVVLQTQAPYSSQATGWSQTQ